MKFGSIGLRSSSAGGALPQRYTGGPYEWYRGRDQVCVMVMITADKIHSMDR